MRALGASDRTVVAKVIRRGLNIAACVGLFTCTAVMASLLPAVRAIRVSPLAALNG